MPSRHGPQNVKFFGYIRFVAVCKLVPVGNLQKNIWAKSMGAKQRTYVDSFANIGDDADAENDDSDNDMARIKFVYKMPETIWP